VEVVLRDRTSHLTKVGEDYAKCWLNMGVDNDILMYREIVSPDANVENIRQKLLARSQVGLLKYGVTTERDDLSIKQWMIHLQEELLDAAVYLEAAVQKLEG
jgi:hypothetical protein